MTGYTLFDSQNSVEDHICEEFDKTSSYEFVQNIFDRMLKDFNGNKTEATNYLIDNLITKLKALLKFLSEVDNPMWIRGASLFFTFNRKLISD